MFVDKYFLTGALFVAAIGSFQDVRTRRIPNTLTYSAYIAALIARSLMLGWPGFKEGLAASLIGGGLFFVLFVLGGMGAGDTKLMAAVTAWAGMANVVYLVFAASVAGGGMAICAMIYRKRIFSTFRNVVELTRHHMFFGMHPHPELNVRDSNATRVPFAPAIAIGTLYCLSRIFSWG